MFKSLSDDSSSSQTTITTEEVDVPVDNVDVTTEEEQFDDNSDTTSPDSVEIPSADAPPDISGMGGMSFL